jgi:hypothetical protein
MGRKSRHTEVHERPPRSPNPCGGLSARLRAVDQTSGDARWSRSYPAAALDRPSYRRLSGPVRLDAIAPKRGLTTMRSGVGSGCIRLEPREIDVVTDRAQRDRSTALRPECLHSEVAAPSFLSVNQEHRTVIHRGKESLEGTPIYTHLSIQKLRELHVATHSSAKLGLDQRAQPGAEATLEEQHAELAVALEDDEDDAPIGLAGVASCPARAPSLHYVRRRRCRARS